MLDTNRLPVDITGIAFTRDHRFAYIRKANVFLYDLQSYKQIEKLPHSRYATVLTSRISDLAWMITPNETRTRFTAFCQGNHCEEICTCIVPEECDNPNCCSDGQDNLYVSSKHSILCWNAGNGKPKPIYRTDENKLINSLYCMNGHVYAAVSTAIPAIEQFKPMERISILDYCVEDGKIRWISLPSILRHPRLEDYSYACLHCSETGCVLVLHLSNKRMVLHFIDTDMHEKSISPFEIEGIGYFQHFSPDGLLFALDTSFLVQTAGKYTLKKSMYTFGFLTNQTYRFTIDAKHYWGWGFSDTSDQILIFNAGKPIPIQIE